MFPSDMATGDIAVRELVDETHVEGRPGVDDDVPSGRRACRRHRVAGVDQLLADLWG